MERFPALLIFDSVGSGRMRSPGQRACVLREPQEGGSSAEADDGGIFFLLQNGALKST